MTGITGLFVSHRGERCGVFQFGARLYAALSATRLIEWHYAECADREEFVSVADRIQPDLILLNYHPFTLAWATPGVDFPSAVVFSVFHEANRSAIGRGPKPPFDVLLCPDPTLLSYDPAFVAVPRFIPEPLPESTAEPATFTVGSFGFGTPGKGFDRLCALVNEQCDTARIRINIPPHDLAAMVPPAAVEAIVADCRRAVTKPGVALEITHEFMDEAALLTFLASNSLNAFLYDEAPDRGISSCTDYALAAGRPIAVSRTTMFRHLHGVNPSICVEERSLQAIAASGTAPLRHLRAAYAPAAAGDAWNRAILDALSARREAGAVPDGRGFNKLLDDRSRAAYGGALADLQALAPEMLSRKIERANIQQAFVLDTTRRLAVRFAEPRILAIGSYEDTAVASLKALGYRIDEVDPQVNGLDLEAFYSAAGGGAEYDLILCTSVLEHVADDEGFVAMTGELLAPGGIAVFTVDFSNRYPVTGVCPAADHRLYTSDDLRHRLAAMLPECTLIDAPGWDDGGDDFEYEGCQYAFASWVFGRYAATPPRDALPARVRPGGLRWQHLLRRQQQRVAEAERERVGAIAEAEREREASERDIALLRQSLGRVTEDWDALTRDLRLERGPKALRLVLPLARLIRRAHLFLGGRDVAPAAAAHTDAAVAAPARSGVTPPSLSRPAVVTSGRSGMRRIGYWATRKAYYAVRPIARPVAYRMRDFLVAGLTQARQATYIPGNHAAASDATGSATELVRLAEEMERVLLTLALERPADRWSVAEAKPPEPSRGA